MTIFVDEYGRTSYLAYMYNFQVWQPRLFGISLKVLFRVIFVANTPEYVYAPLLYDHQFKTGDYIKHLKNVSKSTNKLTRAHAAQIMKYDDDFRIRTNNNYTYYDDVYKGLVFEYSISNIWPKIQISVEFGGIYFFQITQVIS